MTLLAIPNVSEGRNVEVIARFVRVVGAAGARVLDVHSDAEHHRSVLTITGSTEALVEGCLALAAATREIDLTSHRGVHPRLGALDVCPFVPHDSPMKEAVEAARVTAREIGSRLGVPVFLYGYAATRDVTRELPDLRRGGLAALTGKVREGMAPDAGPHEIDPRRGVVCVGARGPLIAFNIWIQAGIARARELANEVRSGSVRALGLAIDQDKAQVAMNLIDPAAVGIQDAFEVVRSGADRLGVPVVATELVGLVERRYLPPPDATVTRLLMEPGHCLEDRLLAKP